MKRSVEIGIAIGVLALLILVIALLLRRGSTEERAVAPSPTQTASSQSEESAETVETPPPPAAPFTVATTFVERFGSYSSESDFANVRDVMPLATLSLQARLEAIIADGSNASGDAYYGISTKVISQVTVEETETSATIRLSTQRQESVGSPGNTTIRYQNIIITLLKDGETWKVDNFVWQT